MGKKGGATQEPAKAEARTERVMVADKHFVEDLTWWVEQDRKIELKILEFIEHILRAPFEGKGKPEPLKALDPNTWSRRLTGEHRLVYVVAADRVTFIQARYHY